jgi:hypothetical protein
MLYNSLMCGAAALLAKVSGQVTLCHKRAKTKYVQITLYQYHNELSRIKLR